MRLNPPSGKRRRQSFLSITGIFLEHNGQFDRHNRVTSCELLKSIIGKKGSIMDSGLAIGLEICTWEGGTLCYYCTETRIVLSSYTLHLLATKSWPGGSAREHIYIVCRVEREHY